MRHGTKKDFRAERVVFVIITGSCDNASRSYTEEMIRKRITYRRQKYGWKFIFYGMGMDAVEEAGKIGIAVEWTRSCNQDTGGLQMAFEDISATLTGFRSVGTEVGMGDEPVEQILRKHWSSMACLTGKLTYPGSMMSSRGEGDGVPEEELLPPGPPIVCPASAVTSSERQRESIRFMNLGIFQNWRCLPTEMRSGR